MKHLYLLEFTAHAVDQKYFCFVQLFCSMVTILNHITHIFVPCKCLVELTFGYLLKCYSGSTYLLCWIQLLYFPVL